MRSILEAYYEPQFSKYSHGFRPNHGCHTTLQDIQQTWKGTRWFIEGDIAQYFDTINHNILLEMLSENIKDGRFIRLVKELLEAGYMEDWKYNKTLSGTPQGGVISPLLSNIYLNKFDRWVEDILIPMYTRGTRRKGNPAYRRISVKLYQMRKKGQKEGVKELLKQRRKLPSIEPEDEGYRRLRYTRYADDFLLGYAGTKGEAEEIKRTIKEWLCDDLKLNLSEEKTLITHATTQKARFLGYDIWTRQDDTWHNNGGRSLNGTVALGVPPEVVNTKCRTYQRKQGKPLIRNDLIRTSDYTIVATYGSEYRGYVQYYQLAGNINWLNKLRYTMERSMMSTLAAKHRRPPWVMGKRHRSTVDTPYGKRRCYEAVQRTPAGKVFTARFGGIPLRRRKHARLIDGTWPSRRGRQLPARLTAGICELCDSPDTITVHHVKRLTDLARYSTTAAPTWVETMRARRRKTLIVCARCHTGIHQ